MKQRVDLIVNIRCITYMYCNNFMKQSNFIISQYLNIVISQYLNNSTSQ